MKKRNFVIPLTVLIVTILAACFMTIFTTDFMSAFFMLKGSRTVTDYKAIRKFAEIRYKLEPNDDALSALSVSYSPYRFIIESENNQTASKEDYARGAQICSREILNEEIEYYNLIDKEISGYIFDIENYTETTSELTCANYLWLLYMSGETQQAKNETQDYINRIFETNYKRASSLSTYLSYVYNNGSEDDRLWALETEQQIVERGEAVGESFGWLMNNSPKYY